METKVLADFISDIRYDRLDQRTVDYAKLCVQDLIGTAIAGSATDTGALWSAYCRDTLHASAAGQAALWDRALTRGDYHAAAAHNAACGHLMDLDDLHNSSIAHLGTVTIPAAIALGQRYRRSGKDVLAAIVAGYEAGARIGEAINPSSYWFWHTTGVVGGFSAAAAASLLLRLTPEQTLNALGNAGTQAAGLWEFMANGSMSKSLHTANATLCGLRAAELASLGFTGAHTILEGERGLIKAIAPDGKPGAITCGLGQEPYKILTNSFKPYACCRHTHSSNDCARWLKQHYHIDPRQIERIIDRTYRLAIDLADKPHPTTPYSYKFSIQYCIAAMLLYDELTEDTFSQAKTGDSAVQALMRKVEVREDPALQSAFADDPTRWSHILEIHMADGQVYTHQVDFPPGDFMNPFHWKDADAKFSRITAGILPDATAERLKDRIRALETLPDINELFA